MTLPAEKGTYILLARLEATRRLTIGRLGRHELHPGHYLYVGSAHGAGGLRGRIGHHLDPDKTLHWHIDYLLTEAAPVEVWYSATPLRLESEWVALLPRLTGVNPSVPRFGSSDHRRGKRTHLFHSRRRPPFPAFVQLLYGEFGPGLLIERETL